MTNFHVIIRELQGCHIITLLICMMMIEDGVRVPMTCLHVRAHHIF